MGDDATRPRVGLLRGAWRAWTRLVRLFVTTLFGVLLLALGLLFFNYVVVATPKDRAYRNLDPAAPVCAAGLAQGWTALADRGLDALGAGAAMEGDGWHDLTDVETAVVAADPSFATKLRCAIQRHVIPTRRAGGTPIDFTLGFLEFKENGEPYALVADDAGRDTAIDSAMLKHAMEAAMRANGGSMAQVHPVITQLDALQQRLRTGANYVLVFIHGWRHDASIGDQDVADTRLYAAHAARFLAERCRMMRRDCATKVTAIYVGWRGARVDERALSRVFGEAAGRVLSAISAGSTLFDRKPVAEAIAPSAISALRSIEGTLAAGDPRNRMIVIGHSLGGDMLATGLKDDLLRAVDRHQPGTPMRPVLGNLVVLLNPAAEARKWTDIQREIFSRQAVRAGLAESAPQNGKPQEGELQGSAPSPSFFPPAQRPSVVSVTSALAFPPGGLRPGDCAWIGLDVDDRFKRARELIRVGLAHTDDMFTTGVDYDFATHDLFPTFKLDFRPAAAYLDRVAARLEHRQPGGESCKAYPPPDAAASLLTLPIRALSSLAATFPFQASAVEETHTIGNLDPPRPPAGVLADAVPSAAPFGTTHEMLGLRTFGAEHHNPYATLADAPLACPATDGWLVRARAARADQDGLFWDSADLAPPAAAGAGQAMPTVRILHGLPLAGSAPITGANDPFWNIRAFDNALSRHDGYRLSSFICAINALVMDDITPDRPALREMASPARQPGSAVLN